MDSTRTTGQARLHATALMVMAASLLAGGCEAPPGEGPGHRKQTLALTPEQELQLGRQAYEQVLSQADVVRGGPMVDRVREVGRRIARAAEIKPLQKEINLRMAGYDFEWQFNVIRNSQVNAFCLPAGKVAVFTGLLGVVENDDQLATVMSHEIAHALAHHASERIARQQSMQMAVDALGGAVGGLAPRRREALFGLLAAGASARGLAYDRAQESEADHIGVFLMTFAGYDPRQAVVFWQLMQRRGAGRHVPEILSDHPSDARRMAQLRHWSAAAGAALNAWRAGRVAPEAR